jgi:hypothetical protein
MRLATGSEIDLTVIVAIVSAPALQELSLIVLVRRTLSGGATVAARSAGHFPVTRTVRQCGLERSLLDGRQLSGQGVAGASAEKIGQPGLRRSLSGRHTPECVFWRFDLLMEKPPPRDYSLTNHMRMKAE